MVKVLKATDQENRPGERVKNMVVHLDSRLSQRTEMMVHLLTELKQLNIDHLMELSDVPNLVRWRRKLTNRTINDDATVSKTHAKHYYCVRCCLRLFLLHYNKMNSICWLSWMQGS